MFVRAPQPEDWPEDAHLENGQYFNTCCNCGKEFIGYKRRCVCKVCYEKHSKVVVAASSIIDGYRHIQEQS